MCNSTKGKGWMLAMEYRGYKNKIKIPHTKVMPSVIFVPAAGLIIYMIGFFSEGTKHSPIALIIRSALSSVEMFVSHSDLLEVHEYWKHNAFYMTLFAIIHFSAILLSGIVIIHYLGVRSASKIRLWRLNHKNEKIKDLYIFRNVDKNSINLAKNISKEEEAKLLDKINSLDRILIRTTYVLNDGIANDNESAYQKFSRLFGEKAP